MYKVAILLSTFNGEKYLKYQLESLEKQRKVNVKLFVIDDFSKDRTLEVLSKTKIPYIIFKNKGRKDPTKNFNNLIKLVPKSFDYYCFCDQDDVWLKNKLIYSIFMLKKHNCDVLGSRTFLTDKNLNIYGKSPNFKKKKNFENSLVQSIAGGNTMIWTNKFHKILNKLDLEFAASHDWMIYQICTFLDKNFFYLKKPLLLYRQHGKNNIGANTGLVNMVMRIVWGLKGRFKKWHEQNYIHLINVTKKFKISKKNKRIFLDFYVYRNKLNPFARLYRIFFKNKVRRQTLQGNIMLIIAILLNKV